jgi:hypothetical protein
MCVHDIRDDNDLRHSPGGSAHLSALPDRSFREIIAA